MTRTRIASPLSPQLQRHFSRECPDLNPITMLIPAVSPFSRALLLVERQVVVVPDRHLNDFG